MVVASALIEGGRLTEKGMKMLYDSPLPHFFM